MNITDGKNVIVDTTIVIFEQVDVTYIYLPYISSKVFT